MKARDYNMQWFVLSVCGLLSGAVSSTVFVVLGYKAIPLPFSWVCSFSIEKKKKKPICRGNIRSQTISNKQERKLICTATKF